MAKWGWVRDRQQSDSVWSCRDDKEVWTFSKGRPKTTGRIEAGEGLQLIYVFKRISLTLLWWMDWREVRVKVKSAERWR